MAACRSINWRLPLDHFPNRFGAPWPGADITGATDLLSPPAAQGCSITPGRLSGTGCRRSGEPRAVMEEMLK